MHYQLFSRYLSVIRYLVLVVSGWLVKTGYCRLVFAANFTAKVLPRRMGEIIFEDLQKYS
jgi:hypothetical protein